MGCHTCFHLNRSTASICPIQTILIVAIFRVREGEIYSDKTVVWFCLILFCSDINIGLGFLATLLEETEVRKEQQKGLAK